MAFRVAPLPPQKGDGMGILKKGWLVFVEDAEDAYHDGFTDERRAGANLELLAIETYGCEFGVVQVDDLPMSPYRRFRTV